MAKRRKKKGRWVFQPLPKWEALPASYYSISKGVIVCSLFHRDLPTDLYDYCVENDVLPPERMGKWRLIKWIEDHRTAARALVVWNNTTHRDRARDRKKFFAAVARRKPKTATL